jgi:hypothetical protein
LAQIDQRVAFLQHLVFHVYFAFFPAGFRLLGGRFALPVERAIWP